MMSMSAVFLSLVLAGVPDEVVAPSVWIQTDHAIGSGTYFQHKGEHLILTAAHVVEELMEPRIEEYIDAEGELHSRVIKKPRTALVSFKGDRNFIAEPVWYSAKWKEGGIDMALLRLRRNAEGTELSVEGLKPALLIGEKDKALEVGEDTHYCGSGGGLAFSLEKSIINNLSERYITTNGIGWYGHSGSGLYVKRDGKWKVAGVVVQAALDPSRCPKTPIECERGVLDFLTSYDESKSK